MPDEPVEPLLRAYRIHHYPSMPIVPAPAAHKWMDQTRERFAYRCLPLLIANQAGWFILNVHKIRCIWNGGEREEDLKIICKGGPTDMPCPAASHFGHGVLTWNLNYLFRTPPGFNLWAHGPPNMPKDGIVPLEGIIETDWSVATFTMNWKMTSVNLPVDFSPGEPICMITPIRRHELEAFVPVADDLTSDPQLQQAFDAWSKSRDTFLKDLFKPGTTAQKEKWQKDYVQGTVSGVTAPEHQVKLNLREFTIKAKAPSPSPPAEPSHNPPEDR